MLRVSLFQGLHAEVDGGFTSSRCIVMGTTPSSLLPLPISRVVALAATGLMRASSAFSSASSVVSWASLSCEACEGKRALTSRTIKIASRQGIPTRGCPRLQQCLQLALPSDHQQMLGMPWRTQ